MGKNNSKFNRNTGRTTSEQLTNGDKGCGVGEQETENVPIENGSGGGRQNNNKKQQNGRRLKEKRKKANKKLTPEELSDLEQRTYFTRKELRKWYKVNNIF